MTIIGSATVHHEDCLTAFRRLSADSIDLIATDPPYFLAGMGNEWSDETLSKGTAKADTVGGLPTGMKFDPRQGVRLQEFFGAVSAEAIRVLKPGGFMVAFSQGRLFHRLAMAAEIAGFEIRDLLIWEHGGGQGKAFTQDHFVRRMNTSESEKADIIERLQGRKTPQLRPKFEAILLAQKPKEGTFVQNWLRWQTGLIATEFSGQQTTVFPYLKPRDGKAFGHLTVKPVDLMERLIEVFSVQGQTVLDPFVGSGTTALAAVRTGRRFVGFEIEKRYVEIASARLRAEQCNQGKAA